MEGIWSVAFLVAAWVAFTFPGGAGRAGPAVVALAFSFEVAVRVQDACLTLSASRSITGAGITIRKIVVNADRVTVGSLEVRAFIEVTVD